MHGPSLHKESLAKVASLSPWLAARRTRWAAVVCLKRVSGESGGILRLKMCSDCLSRWLNPAETAGTHYSLPRCRHALDDGAQHIVHVLPADRDFRGELHAVAEHWQGGAFDIVRRDEGPAIERGEGFADFY